MSEHTGTWREFFTPQWVGGGAVTILVLWFGWLYPLVPVTAAGWVVELGSGLLVGVWTILCVAMLLWLQRQTKFVWACRAAGVVVAVSLGGVIFASAYSTQAFLTQNFSYFGR